MIVSVVYFVDTWFIGFSANPARHSKSYMPPPTPTIKAQRSTDKYNIVFQTIKDKKEISFTHLDRLIHR